MTYRVFVLAAAEPDISDAQDWYDRQAPGLALRFTDEFPRYPRARLHAREAGSATIEARLDPNSGA